MDILAFRNMVHSVGVMARSSGNDLTGVLVMGID